MDQVEDNLKALEGMNSMYPKMDIKPLGGGTKSQNKISRSSSFSNSDAVQEEDRDVMDAEDLTNSMTKSKFKHVNIITDSDEFNQHKISDQMTSSQPSAAQLARIRSTSGDQAYGDSIQEDKIEDENDAVIKMTSSKLGISTHSIEESILLDKGEFDCSTPTRPKGTAILKKINSQIQYSQYNQKEEIITEDPEKETDGNFVTRISSHKEIKLKVDEIDNIEKSKSFTPRINYMDHSVPIIEETKEEELMEGNKQLQSAKNEREQEKGYIKKLVKGDTIHQGEKLVHIAETSGITSHMPGNQIKENQNDEDVGDNEEEENVAEEYQKRRRSSLNIVDTNFNKEEEEDNIEDEEDEDDD